MVVPGQGYRQGINVSMPVFRGLIELRNFTTEDYDDILDIYHRCEDFLSLGPQPRASSAMVTKDIDDAGKEGGSFKGIYSGDTLIGVASYSTKGFNKKLTDAYLYLLMIIPSFRGKGIGTKIVKMIEKEIFTDSKATTIFSGVQVNNLRALKFWRNNGYRVTGGPELMPDNTTVFHLRKDLRHIT
jgi:ribosomal protein S18 acetylase RimI-like enzyme